MFKGNFEYEENVKCEYFCGCQNCHKPIRPGDLVAVIWNTEGDFFGGFIHQQHLDDYRKADYEEQRLDQEYESIMGQKRQLEHNPEVEAIAKQVSTIIAWEELHNRN